MEKWEEQEIEKTMDTLREEDRQWESKMKGKRSEVSKSSTAIYGGGKREGREQASSRRRKRLKFDLVEDDWRQWKTTDSQR